MKTTESTILDSNYIWDWNRMTCVSARSEFSCCYKVRWSEGLNNLIIRDLRDPSSDWVQVSGHDLVVEHYKNYIADKILLEE